MPHIRHQHPSSLTYEVVSCFCGQDFFFKAKHSSLFSFTAHPHQIQQLPSLQQFLPTRPNVWVPHIYPSLTKPSFKLSQVVCTPTLPGQLIKSLFKYSQSSTFSISVPHTAILVRIHRLLTGLHAKTDDYLHGWEMPQFHPRLMLQIALWWHGYSFTQTCFTVRFIGNHPIKLQPHRCTSTPDFSTFSRVFKGACSDCFNCTL